MFFEVGLAVYVLFVDRIVIPVWAVQWQPRTDSELLTIAPFLCALVVPPCPPGELFLRARGKILHFAGIRPILSM